MNYEIEIYSYQFFCLEGFKMNKILSITGLSLLSCAFALTSCGKKNTNNTSQSDIKPNPNKIKLSIDKLFAISQKYSSNLLSDKTHKWEIDTTVNCEGILTPQNEIINQESNNYFLLDSDKKCTIVLNKFKYDDYSYSPVKNALNITVAKNSITTNSNNIQYKSDKTTNNSNDILYFTAALPQKNHLILGFSNLEKQITKQSLIPHTYNFKIKSPDKIVSIKSEYSYFLKDGIGYTLPDSPLQSLHSLEWGEDYLETTIDLEVKDMNSPTVFKIKLKGKNFVKSYENYFLELNHAVGYKFDGFSTQFALSYDPDENKELPKNAKYTGQLNLNALGWNTHFFKNIIVNINIDNTKSV